MIEQQIAAAVGKNYPLDVYAEDVIAEITRLHAENERLRAENERQRAAIDEALRLLGMDRAINPSDVLREALRGGEG